jgi:O-antigen/teichoic acid export membrane protein
MDPSPPSGKCPRNRASFKEGDAVPLGQISAVTFILSGTSYVLTQAFLAAVKPGVIAIIQAASILLALQPLLVLIPRFGLIGVASAILIATALRELATMSCLSIILKVPMPSPILTFGDIRFVVESLSKAIVNARCSNQCSHRP